MGQAEGMGSSAGGTVRRGGRPGIEQSGRAALATEVKRVLAREGSGSKPLSYRQASLRLGDKIHFTIIGNMAMGLGASPPVARTFAEGFGEDGDFFSAIASGVPLSMLKRPGDGTFDVLSRIGVRVSPELLSVPLSDGSVSAGGRVIEGGDSHLSLSQEIGQQVEAIRVVGDCMEPEVKDGDILLVRRSETASAGQMVVASAGSFGTPHVKVFDMEDGKPVLRSLDGGVIRTAFRISGIVIGFTRLFP